jgi:hypothetical protein
MIAGKRLPPTLSVGMLALAVGCLSTLIAGLASGQPVTRGVEMNPPSTAPEAHPNELKFEVPKNDVDVAALNAVEKRTFAQATAAFASFCQNWERMLHDREIDNRGHLEWHENRGYETAIFVAYSKLESCQCKLSAKRSPLGELKYKELSYYLVGKTIDEANQTRPLLYGATETLEIFSWEKNRWTY